MINIDFVLKLMERDSDIKQHLFLLYLIPVLSGAKVIVELGAGQSSYALTAAANVTGGRVYSFDLTKESITRFFPEGEGILDKESRFLFTKTDDLLVDWNTPIDVLFIDTSHTYEQTKAELEKYVPWVKTGGVIMMHDTSIDSPHWVDCRRAMMEYLEETKYPAVHFPNQNGFSIIYKT